MNVPVLIVAAALLAHDHHLYRWITFELCAVDRSVFPHKSFASRDHSQKRLRADKIGAINDIFPIPEGIACCEIGSITGHTAFVVGSCQEVLKKIQGNPG